MPFLYIKALTGRLATVWSHYPFLTVADTAQTAPSPFQRGSKTPIQAKKDKTESKVNPWAQPTPIPVPKQYPIELYLRLLLPFIILNFSNI